jgi:hypothetical protein
VTSGSVTTGDVGVRQPAAQSWGSGVRTYGASAGEGRVPLTGLARLDGLIGEVRLCGVPVALTVTGVTRPLPAETVPVWVHPNYQTEQR